MDSRDRSLPIDEAHLIPVVLLDQLQRRREATAERALEIRELDDRDWRFLAAEEWRTRVVEGEPIGLELHLDVRFAIQSCLQAVQRGLFPLLTQEIPDLRTNLIEGTPGGTVLIRLVPAVDVRIGRCGNGPDFLRDQFVHALALLLRCGAEHALG